MKIIITLIAFFFLLPLHSQASFFNKKDFHFALGAETLNQFHKRGITTYGGYQVFPIFAVDLFNPNLQIIGSSLHYRLFFTKNFYLRTRLATNSTKDKPLYFTSEKELERVRREKTNEADLYLEYKSSENHYYRFQFSQDLVAHKGQYAELFGHYPLWGGFYQLGIFTSLGAGTTRHNEYFYGSGAGKFGLNNLEYGLMLTAPSVIDMYFPVVRISHFSILGNENKSASFVQEKSGFSIEALFAFRIF